MDKEVYDFLCNSHQSGRNGFSDDGFNHYLVILTLIKEKLYNPSKRECNFIELCVNGEWEKAKYIADTRNKEAIDYNNMFYKFIEYIKSTSNYKLIHRESLINKLSYG